MATKAETDFHLKDIATALADVEAGQAGNDEHYKAIKALANAVSYLLVEARLNARE